MKKKTQQAIKNPHFWAIIFLTIFLIFIYQAWPWRIWKFDYGVWRWFTWLSSLYELALFEAQYRIGGVLFLIPIIYSSIAFSWKGSLITFLFSLIVVFPVIANVWSTTNIITNVLVLLLPLLIASLINFAVSWRNRERRIFAERELERQMYTSKILESQENERKRIAQELHDDTIPTLLIIANRAQAIASFNIGDMKDIKENSESIKDISLQAVENVRRISLYLRPSILDDFGLIPALRWLVERATEESNLDARICVKGIERKLDPQLESGVFRCVQEGLNNIRRHSKALEATVSLEFTEELLKIDIEDNGQGLSSPVRFDKLAVAGKYGLVGMQERIKAMNGKLEILSSPGKGTSLFIEIKYDNPNFI
jgi:two-component system, NarL family, sensor histidine kinase DegS